MQPVERRLLIKVANMYYIENMKQTDIADKLGVNRTTISKYLKKAMQSGIVKISIVNDSYENLENELERRFGLKEAYVVDSADDAEEVRNKLGHAGLDFLRRVVQKTDVIGFAWGTSMGAMADNVVPDKNMLSGVDIIPLVGGVENVDSKYHVNSIITKIAESYGATSHCLYAPAVCQTAAIKEAIIQNANYQKIASLWDKLTIAFVGIGVQIKNSNVVWSGEFGHEYIEELSSAGAIGEICSIFYDIHGKIIPTSLRDKTVAIDIEKLSRVNYSVGIAASLEKVPAIYGALQGRLVNVLITDEVTARALLVYRQDV